MELMIAHLLIRFGGSSVMQCAALSRYHARSRYRTWRLAGLVLFAVWLVETTCTDYVPLVEHEPRRHRPLLAEPMLLVPPRRGSPVGSLVLT